MGVVGSLVGAVLGHLINSYLARLVSTTEQHCQR